MKTWNEFFPQYPLVNSCCINSNIFFRFSFGTISKNAFFTILLDSCWNIPFRRILSGLDRPTIPIHSIQFISCSDKSKKWNILITVVTISSQMINIVPRYSLPHCNFLFLLKWPCNLYIDKCYRSFKNIKISNRVQKPGTVLSVNSRI